MPHNPNSQKKLSMKTRLVLIAIMFVIINLIFYVGFDSSDESNSEHNLDNQNSLDNEITDGFDIEISDFATP